MDSRRIRLREQGDHTTISHRQLLTPGPDTSELKVKALPCQQQACGTQKRKADAADLDQTSASPTSRLNHQGRYTTTTDDDQSDKALQVIEHQFWNGNLTSDQSAKRATGFTDNGAEIIDQTPRSATENPGLKATPTHLVYKTTRGGEWRTTERVPRQYNFGIVSQGVASERGFGPLTAAGHRPRIRSPESAFGDEASTGHEPACGADVQPDYPRAHLDDELTVWNSGPAPASSGPNLCHNMVNSVVLPASRETLPCTYRGVPESRLVGLRDLGQYPIPVSHPAGLTPSFHGPLLSLRDLAARLPPIHERVGTAEDRSTSSDGVPEEQRIGHFNAIAFAPWESANGGSHANCQVRRARELALGQGSQTTSAPPAPTTDTGFPVASAGVGAFHAAASENLVNTIGMNEAGVSTNLHQRPPRYQNQDTDCLICLEPVTAAQLAIINLRCAACPRVFHGHCVNYIPPSGNQNWRCSLCYKEAWHGYGHLPDERDLSHPSLVERYRRRLLLAKTYSNPDEPASVRFWLTIDMDGGRASDQAVIVKMGVGNLFYLRPILGQNRIALGGTGSSVEERERWAIALAMSLQETEANGLALRSEVSRLAVDVAVRKDNIQSLNAQVDQLKTTVMVQERAIEALKRNDQSRPIGDSQRPPP